MRAIAVLFALASIASAQVVISEVEARATHAFVGVRWTVSTNIVDGNSRCDYGPTAALGQNSALNNDVSMNVLKRECYILASPNTPVYFKPWTVDSTWTCVPGTGYTCEGDVGVITTEPLPPIHPVPPTAITPNNTTMPVINGTNFPVTSCANVQAALDSCGAADPALNHTVTITAGLSCTQTILLPTKAGAGNCIIRSSAFAVATPPAPEDVRVDKQDEAQHAVTLVRPYRYNDQGARGIITNYITDQATEGWRFIGIAFRGEGVNTAPVRAFSVTAVTDAGVITVSEPHGFATHQIVNISGITGFRGRGPNMEAATITVTNSTSFSIQNSSISCAVAGCYAGGGRVVQSLGHIITAATNTNPVVITTATEHGLPVEPWVPITSFVGSGSINTAYFNLGTGMGTLVDGRAFMVEIRNSPVPGLDGMRYTISSTTIGRRGMRDGLVWNTSCASNCGEMRFREAIFIQGGRGNTAINKGHTYTVLGPNTLQLDDAVGNGAYTGGGVAAFDPGQELGLLDIRPPMTRIVFDRCWFDGGGFPNRWTYGIALRGQDQAIINSHMEGFHAWTISMGSTIQASLRGWDQLTTTGVDFTGSKRVKLHNNAFINLNGISVYGQQGDGINFTEDTQITRNFFFTAMSFLNSHAESDGGYYPKRHNVEFKMGKRALVAGNTHIGNWVDRTPCGPTYALSLRGANGGYENTLSDFEVSNNFVRDTSTAFNLTGYDSYFSHVTATPSARLVFDNNLVRNTDNRKYFANPTSELRVAPGLCGYYAGFTQGMEDVGVINGTHVGNRSTNGNTFSWSTPSEGMTIRNNLVEVTSDNAGGPLINGLTSGSTVVSGKLASWNVHLQSILDNWVIIPTVKNSLNTAAFSSSAFADTWTGANCDTYMAGFTGYQCLAGTVALDRIEAAKLWCGRDCMNRMQISATRVRWDSPAISGAKKASHGGDLGVDHDRLEAALGHVDNDRVTSLLATSATVAFLAPDSFGCSVDYSQSGELTTFERVTNAGGSRFQSVPLTGLSGGTLYHYRINCQAERLRGSFRTR